MTRVLAVLPRIPFPAVSGGEKRVLALIEGLSSRYEFSLMTLLPSEDPRAAAAAALHLEGRWFTRVRLIPRGPAPSSERRLAVPDYARWYYDPAFEQALRDAVRRDGADLVHLEFAEMGQYVRVAAEAAPSVFTQHDAGLVSLTRSHLKRGYRWYDWRRYWQWRCRRADARLALNHADRAVALSDADARRLSRLGGRGRVRVVPTGVDLRHFAFHGSEGRDRSWAVFLGHYPHYPNEDAALFLCRDILPRLRRLRPGVRIVLAGSSPTPDISALAGESVWVPGTQPDIRPFLMKAGVFLAPLRLGFGIKGKILEAMAAGAPVVATPQSLEAFPGLEDGRHVLIGRSARELAQKAACILADPGRAAALGEAARAYVEERFGWDRQIGLLDQVFREAIEEGRLRLRAARDGEAAQR